MPDSDSLPPTEQYSPDIRKHGKKILLISFLSFFTLFIFLLVILYFQISTNRKMSKSIASLKEFIEIQNNIINNRILSSSEHLENITNDQTDRIIAVISITNRNVNRIEQVYNALLDEQKKKTLQSLYNESFVIDRYENAEKLFSQNKYRQAYDEFSFVSNEQPENLNAIFFKYYSLFLINKGDQSQYRTIKNSLLQLQKRGYTRSEIQEILDFISNEEIPSAQSEKEDIQ